MNGNISINITFGSLLKIAIFCFFVYILFEVRDFVALLLTAVIFSLALAPGRRFLEKFKIPGPIAVVFLFIAVLSAFTFLLYSFVPLILEQYNFFISSIPTLFENLLIFSKGTIFEAYIQGQIAFFEDPQQASAAFTGIFKTAGVSLLTIFGGLLNIILFLLLTFLFAVNPSALETFINVIAPKKYKNYLGDLWKRTGDKMAQWIQGQILLVFVIGALTYFALTLLGIPNALFLATFAGIMELIPIFGPVIAAIPAVLMALTTGDFTLVLLVILVFLIIQQLENNLIYPLVVSKVVGVSSILVILAIVVGGSIAGFIGVVIAVPVVMVLQELFNDMKSGKIEKSTKP